MEKAKLINANCTGATFRKANCYEAKFSKAKLTDCIFTECNLLWCTFKNSKGDVALDSFNGADVGYADFTKGCITTAHLVGARNVDKAKNIPAPKKKRAQKQEGTDDQKEADPSSPTAGDMPSGPPRRIKRTRSFGRVDPEMRPRMTPRMGSHVSQEPKDYGNIDENTEQ